MGSNFSSRKDVYVHQFVNPRIQDRSEQIMIRMMAVPGETYMVFADGKTHCNPFEKFVSRVDDGQEAIITGIYGLFINNESNHSVTMDITGLFESKSQNEDVHHIDDDGKMKILCPAGINKALEGNDRILYKPRLMDETIRMYAGLEMAILKDFSVSLETDDSAPVMLEYSHPLVHFIVMNMDILQPVPGDVIKHDTTGYLQVTRAFLIRAREFFADKIVRDLHPTRFEETQCSCLAPKELLEEAKQRKIYPNVTIVLQMNYLLITPGERKMKHYEIKV